MSIITDLAAHIASARHAAKPIALATIDAGGSLRAGIAAGVAAFTAALDRAEIEWVAAGGESGEVFSAARAAVAQCADITTVQSDGEPLAFERAESAAYAIIPELARLARSQ